VACGTGTVEKDGACVPSATGLACGEGTVEKDGACVPSATGLACGEGTVEKDGSCVAEPVSTKPHVESVKLTHLAIADEEQTFYLEYPMTADIALEVQGDAFDAMVLLGFSNEAGDKHCFVGNWVLSHGGGPDVATITASMDFIVQPGCKQLLDAKEAHAWVSFDPFQQLEVKGYVAPVVPEKPSFKDLLNFIMAGGLSMDGCKAGDESPHPDSCETKVAFGVEDKLDVVIDDAKLSSNVAVLQVSSKALDFDPIGIVDLDPKLKAQTDAKPDDATTSEAHFVVNADMTVYGPVPEDGAEDVFLTFAIRPAGTDEDWMPLYAEIHEVSKAGDEATAEKLLEMYLDSLVQAYVISRSSPIFITGDTEPMIATGAWSGHQIFDLLVCAGRNDEDDTTDDTDVDIVHTALEADSGSNDCAMFRVAVIRQTVTPNGPAAGLGSLEIPSGWWLRNWEWTGQQRSDLWLARLKLWYGFYEKIGRQQQAWDYWPGGQSWCTGDAMNLGAKGGIDLEEILNQYNFNVASVHLALCDAASDYIGARYDMFGINFIDKTVSVPDGTIKLGQVVPEDMREKTLYEKVIGSYGWIIPGTTVGLGVSLKVEGKIGLDGDKSSLTKAPAKTGCDAEGGDMCYIVGDDFRNWDSAKQGCTAMGAKLARPTSQAVQGYITAAFNAKGHAYGWVDFATFCNEWWFNDPNCAGNETKPLPWITSDPYGGGWWNGYGLAWAGGQPQSYGYAYRRALQTNWGGLYAFPWDQGMAYVCEKPTANKTLGGTTFTLVINPFANFSAIGFGGLDIPLEPWEWFSFGTWVSDAVSAVVGAVETGVEWVADHIDPSACAHIKVGVEGTLELIRVDLPVTFTVGYTWDAGGNVAGGITGLAQLAVSMLNGSLRAIGEAICLSVSQDIVTWDGLDILAPWTIWSESWSF
jgi:hypothetical protein